MVWHFIGVYIINRILHGRLEIRNFSSRVEKNISLFRYAHSWNIFQHSKRNFVSPRSHVISSICIPLIYIYSLLFLRYIVKPMRTTLSCFETSRIYFTCVYFFVPTLANQGGWGRGGEERKVSFLPLHLPALSFFGSRFISRAVKTENPIPRFFCSETERKSLLRRLSRVWPYIKLEISANSTLPVTKAHSIK